MKRLYFLIIIYCFSLSLSLPLSAQQRLGRKGGKPFVEQRNDSSAATQGHRFAMGAKKSAGMFNIYKTGKGDYFIEIPDSLLGRDILFGSRVCSISNNSKISAGQRRSNPVMITFSRAGKMLLMKQPNIISYCDNTDRSAAQALAVNNVTPTVMTFDIAERNETAGTSIIDVTKLFTSEVALVWPAGVTNGVGHLDARLTQIVSAKTFARNVEFKTFYNYNGGKEPFCLTVQYSFILLPREAYRWRYYDDRVGFSNEVKRKYGSTLPIVSQHIIDRWRIEPRQADITKFKKGELVEPARPIVFYVDTLMPEKWRKYVRQGIETWNMAFEKIGFKHVVRAIDYPRSAAFDADDSRYNCFKYVSSSEANAQGSQWIDPRSGEIVQGEILWWHSVMDKLRSWLFVQTAAADKDVRLGDIPEATLGAAIRYATAHEMGHVLGLQHNMRASYAYPTDSLRSASFTQKYGTTASIMDYARNNYVAQPGDKEKGVYLYPPQLGPYDYMAIEYGYRYFPEAASAEEELNTLSQWLNKTVAGNPMYQFSSATISPVLPDPASQSDALGNDLVKSARYGVANLQYIMNHLVEWSVSKGGSLDLLKSRYDDIVKQFTKITSLPLSYVGGVYNYRGTYGQHKSMSVVVAKSKQQETIAYLFKTMVEAPGWLTPVQVTRLVESADNEIIKWQNDIMDNLLGLIITSRILDNEKASGYTPQAYLRDIDTALWSNTLHNSLTSCDKNLQMRYVENLVSLASSALSVDPKDKSKSYATNVWASAAYSQLAAVVSRLSNKISTAKTDKAHYHLLLRMAKNY